MVKTESLQSDVKDKILKTGTPETLAQQYETQEDEINVESIREITTEKKTALPSVVFFCGGGKLRTSITRQQIVSKYLLTCLLGAAV